ncbi:hypothetical protein S7711_04374 [Stachybotrys chartarum IBT 7711]|uniref:Gfd2/YDR514C-like C-terminal domain-containing protein n=1 Tax=Stachybotrys chartarum (strain CBS 109288 / IBT 7711) TaxID=1280523 RepID=A0A084AY87_STACB|nr:hypothetical protein S7711_04374 [Stachybotrys chartarum IBT 7711]
MEDDVQSRLDILANVLGQKVELKPITALEEEQEKEGSGDDRLTQDDGWDCRWENRAIDPWPEPTAEPPARKACQALHDSDLKMGASLPGKVYFCAWELVVSYPDRYVGVGNRPRVKPFFEGILDNRTWDFFYVHDVSKRVDHPFLLVPTNQLEEFLWFINDVLSTCLTIPKGPSSERFFLRFDAASTPQPRYFRRYQDEEALDIKSWPAICEDDISAYNSAAPQHKAIYEANMERLKTLPETGKDADFRRHKAAQKHQHRIKMLQDVENLLGLSGLGKVSVVFVCIDIEALETAPNPISEVGISILDMNKILDISPGEAGSSWWPTMEDHHLRVNEYKGSRNYRLIQGCPDAFNFGTSVFPPKADLASAIMKIINPHIRAERELVFVGHDFKNDMQYLVRLGIDIKKLQRRPEPVDTQAMHQAWREKTQGYGLRHVLNDVGIACKNLHNAGNDAAYTLRAMVAIAINASAPDDADGASASDTFQSSADPGIAHAAHDE